MQFQSLLLLALAAIATANAHPNKVGADSSLTGEASCGAINGNCYQNDCNGNRENLRCTTGTCFQVNPCRQTWLMKFLQAHTKAANAVRRLLSFIQLIPEHSNSPYALPNIQNIAMLTPEKLLGKHLLMSVSLLGFGCGSENGPCDANGCEGVNRRCTGNYEGCSCE